MAKITEVTDGTFVQRHCITLLMATDSKISITCLQSHLVTAGIPEKKNRKQEVVRQLLPQLTSHKQMLLHVTVNLFDKKCYPHCVNSNGFELLQQIY